MIVYIATCKCRKCEDGTGILDVCTTREGAERAVRCHESHGRMALANGRALPSYAVGYTSIEQQSLDKHHSFHQENEAKWVFERSYAV